MFVHTEPEQVKIVNNRPRLQFLCLTFSELLTTLVVEMDIFSTRQAAKKLGINAGTLSRYISLKKVRAPKTVRFGNLKVHAWSKKDIERVRKLLPKIENGRHTRYKKQRKKNTK